MNKLWKVTRYGKEKTIAVHNQDGECVAVCNSSTADNEANAELIASAPTLRAQNEKLREALRQINNSNNWWFKDGTYVWANKEDLHEWIEKRIEESK